MAQFETPENHTETIENEGNFAAEQVEETPEVLDSVDGDEDSDEDAEENAPEESEESDEQEA